jgi:hypothetical protein
VTTEGEGSGSRRGVRKEVTDPAGRTYLVQAAPSGFVQWSRGGHQPPVGFLAHTVVTWLLNRLVFRGGWTLVAWHGDWIARKRTRVAKQRYRTQAEAIEAWQELTATIVRSGPPAT